MFWLMNMVRKAATRMERVTAPQRHRLKHHVCGGSIRLVRSRPQSITEDQLNTHYDELCDLQRRGILQVREVTVEGKIHVFDEKRVEARRAVKRDKQALTRSKAQLIREGRLEEARALTAAPQVEELLEVLRSQEVVAEETATEEPLVVEEPVVVEEPAEEPELSKPSSKTRPDFSKMNKVALLDWLYTNAGVEDGAYDGYSKKQLLKIAEDL